MDKSKPYNPDRKFWIRRRRRNGKRNSEQSPHAAKSHWNFTGCLIAIMVAFVLGIVVWLVIGVDAILKWFSG